jgi:hypothetical protein
MRQSPLFGSFTLNQADRIAKGLRREALIATRVAALLIVTIGFGLMASSGPGSVIDWSVVRAWALFIVGLFFYGHLARKVVQLAEALRPPNDDSTATN